MHFEQQPLRSTSRSKSAPTRPSERMESDKEEVSVDADVKGDEEELSGQEDESEELGFGGTEDEGEDDTRRSRFIA